MEVLARRMNKGHIIPFCPEIAVGFPTLLPPVEIVGSAQSSHINSQGKDVINGDARVIEGTGEDVTD